MATTRKCDAYQCAATVAAGRFLCPRHWRLVPVATQRTINMRYRAGRADFAFLSDAQYLQACIDAIAGLAHQEGHADSLAIGEATSYGRLLKAARRKEATP